ncbi:MAG TPA: NAD(P)-dependent oxidoreductase [Pseudolabrys sp.]|jgi:phosphoglycerate dehydrogenase-like enzyme
MGHKTLFLTNRGEVHQGVALEAAPPELDVIMRRAPSKDEVLALLPDCEFLISERTGVIDADLIAAGKKLRLIQRLGSQTWDIDLAAAKKAGIPVSAIPVRTCVLVAEHMLMQMLGLGKHIRELVDITDKAGDWGMPPRRCNENYFAFNWSKRKKVDGLYQSTVGILGFGEIGTELARRLKGFGCEVLYAKRRPLPRAVEEDLGLTHVSRDELARRSDYIGCLLPNLPENNQTIGRDFFSQMKRGAYFAHCGAPGVVIEDDMLRALAEGQLGGGAIDCYTYEPLRPDDPMVPVARVPSNNLILTPHVAAGTVAVSREERVPDFANIVRVLKGETVSHRLV